MAGINPERVFVQVVDVDVAAGREISFGKSLAEGLTDRQDDIRGAIEAGSQTVANSIESLPSPPGWRLGEVSAMFGITQTAARGLPSVPGWWSPPTMWSATAGTSRWCMYRLVVRRSGWCRCSRTPVMMPRSCDWRATSSSCPHPPRCGGPNGGWSRRRRAAMTRSCTEPSPPPG